LTQAKQEEEDYTTSFATSPDACCVELDMFIYY